MLQTVVIHNY